MKIEINPQFPDGINLSVEGIIFDTDEQVYAFLRLIREIQTQSKFNFQVEVCNMLKNNFNIKIEEDEDEQRT